MHDPSTAAQRRDGTDLRSRTLTGLRWSGVSQVVRQTLQFAITITLARILTPHDFGLMGMVVVFAGFADLFSELGLGAALIQKLTPEARHLNSVFWANVAAGVALSLLFALLAPLIAGFYDRPILRDLTLVIAVNYAIGSLKVVQISLLQKHLDFRRLAWVEIVAMAIAGAVAIGLAAKGFGVWSLAMQSLVAMACSTAMLWLLSPWRPAIQFDWAALRELLGFSSPLLGYNVVNYWARNLDRLLIGRFLGSSALGFYVRAYLLMLLPIQQISGVMARVMFPALAEIQGDLAKVGRVYLRATRIIALVTFPMMMGLLVLARPFVLGVYGEPWSGAIPILRVFCLTGMSQSIGTTVGWIYNSQGRTDLQLRWGLLAGAVYALSFVAGLPWGALGVATSYTLAGFLILWYPGWSIPVRLINLRFADMLRNLQGPFFASVAMAAVVWGAHAMLPRDWPSWAELAVGVPAGVATYGILVHAFRLQAYQDVRGLLRDLMRPRLVRDAPVPHA